VHGLLLAAAISPDNTPHGYNLTFAFPMLMFIIIAGGLYLRFRSTHRVPGHIGLASSRWANTPPDAPEVPPHSPEAAAQPIAAAMEPTDPGAAITAQGVTAEAPLSGTTPGSTLQEGTSAPDAESPGPERLGPESPGSGSTEDSE
jgi:hypothetical protein